MSLGDAFKQVLNLYRCMTCHYEIEVSIASKHQCPSCGKDMMFITTVRR